MARRPWLTLASLLISIIGMGCADRKTFPVASKPAAIPGRIEMENFDEGTLWDRAYKDSSRGSEAPPEQFYRNSDVDLGVDPLLNLVDVGWVRPGEWLEFTVHVRETANYIIRARIATPLDGKHFSLRWNGQPLVDAIPVPNAGCWGSDLKGGHCFLLTEPRMVALQAGTGRLRLEAGSGDYTIDWIEFTTAR